MKKTIIVGIISVVILVGILSILSINAIFLTDGSQSSLQGPKMGELEANPLGRNFSVNLEEKMGFATP